MEKIICGLCNREIALTVLPSHLLIQHGWKMAAHEAKPVADAVADIQRPCKCPMCNASLKDAKRLQKHINKLHAGADRASVVKHAPAKKQSISTVSYTWALAQPLDKKHAGVVDKFVTEKTVLELEKEITAIVNSYDAADTARQSLLSGRLVLLSHAMKRVLAKNKAKKKKKVITKNKKTGRTTSGDIMDQYIGGRRIVVSGGLPSLGKR